MSCRHAAAADIAIAAITPLMPFFFSFFAAIILPLRFRFFSPLFDATLIGFRCCRYFGYAMLAAITPLFRRRYADA